MGTRSRPVELLDNVTTIGAMIDHGIAVRAICQGSACDVVDIDLVALAGRVGLQYSLIGRRCRCRRCRTRWVRFYYLAGVYRPLWTWRDVDRWSVIDRASAARASGAQPAS